MAVTLGSTGVTFPDASIQTTAAGASALVYISQAVASNSATVSFTGLTAYDNYMVIFSKIAPSSTDEANNFLMYTSTNNGSSYATTSYNYAMSFVITSSASVGVKASEADGNTFIRLSAGTFSSNNSNCSISGDITLNLKDSTKYFFQRGEQRLNLMLVVAQLIIVFLLEGQNHQQLTQYVFNLVQEMYHQAHSVCTAL